MMENQVGSEETEGIRERKQRETSSRIAQAGLTLFISRGFEETTLDDIADAAGIGRRTFFNYFKSKEDVLLAHDGSGFSSALKPALLSKGARGKPIDLARETLMELADRYETKESILVDRLLNSTDNLRRRKQAMFVDLEATVLEAFVELWPAPQQRDRLAIVAMAVVGALRIALVQWRERAGTEPLRVCIERNCRLVQGKF